VANYTPPDLVAGAPRVPLPFGLFSVLDPRPDGSAHWRGGGVQFEYLDPFTVDSIGPTQTPQSDTQGLPKNLDFPEDSGDTRDPGYDDAGVFTVYGHYKVSPIAWSPEDAQARASEVLQAFEEREAERIFWTGDKGNTPNLTDGIAAVGTWDVSKINSAIGALERFIADTYGSLGVIHMNRQLAAAGMTSGTLKANGSRLFTALGTPVAAGAGYPSGSIRATPALFGYRSEIFTSSARRGDLLDTKNNDLYAVAERNYLIGFDPTGVGSVTINDI
jgi:hypothetical protein